MLEQGETVERSEEHPDRIEVAISYRYSYSLWFPEGTWSNEKKYAYVTEQLKQNGGCITLAEGADEPVFREIVTTQEFLHGGGLPFPCQRFLLPSLQPRLEKFPLDPVAVHLAVFAEQNVAQLCFCFYGTVTTDQLIYLRHIVGGAPAFFDPADEQNRISLDGLMERSLGAMGCTLSGEIDRTYMAEIKDYRGFSTIEDIMEQEPQRVYGILCGDEGWAFVPRELAESRLSQYWGSREFVRFIPFGNNALCFNLHRSPAALAYQERQRDFGERTYGGVNPYFLLDSRMAGVDHGIMLAQESITVIKTVVNRILRRKNNFRNAEKLGLNQEIRKTKIFRNELINTLNQVENLAISEMGELEQLLLNSYRVSPLIDDTKYLLEMLESDLELLYQQSTNRLINVLTVAGLLLSFAGILLSEFF